MAERIIVWGAGGHGGVVADLIDAVTGYELLGFADNDLHKLDSEAGTAKVLVTDSDLRRVLAETGALPQGATALAHGLGDNRLRWQAHAVASAARFPVLVHPTSWVSSSASLGAGTVVLPAAVVNARATIGEAVVLNTACVVEHDCVVADGAHVSPGVVLSGGVRVGARAWIGANATVIPCVEIGPDATVGAGAVVLEDVAAGATVVGSPARVIREAADEPIAT